MTTPTTTDRLAIIHSLKEEVRNRWGVICPGNRAWLDDEDCDALVEVIVPWVISRHRIAAVQSLAADNARLLALVGAAYPIPHDEGCELDPDFGDSVWSLRMKEEDPDGDLDQRWPNDAKCTCGTDELNAQARAALNPTEGVNE